MDEKQKQTLKQHYAELSDETLLGLLNDKEAGLIDGAYELAMDEAIKRTKGSPDFKIPEQSASLGQKPDKSQNGKGSFFSWKFALIGAFILTALQLFKQHDLANNQKIVNIIPTAKVVIPKLNTDDMANAKEVETILMNAMTADEKTKYLALFDKIANKSATKQDYLDNGHLTQAVTRRLPQDKKEIVQRHNADMKKKFGNDMQKTFDQ